MCRGTFAAAVVVAFFASCVMAAPTVEPASESASLAVSEKAAPLDLVRAEADGLVAVRYIANNSKSAQLIVTNRSGRPLTLRLPAAFVGVPVLAQMGMNQAGAGFGAGGIGAQPQTVGGGGGGMMPGGGMQGGAGAAFSIQPEKTRVLKVKTVCLEHGKPEPSPRQTYKLDRFEAFSSDPALASVLEALGRGAISPQVAQAAAWHLSNGLSWEQLAAEKIDHVIDEDEPFFSPQELAAARQVVAEARRAADLRKAGPTGESTGG